jgi:hypothetical protein
MVGAPLVNIFLLYHNYNFYKKIWKLAMSSMLIDSKISHDNQSSAISDSVTIEEGKIAWTTQEVRYPNLDSCISLTLTMLNSHIIGRHFVQAPKGK